MIYATIEQIAEQERARANAESWAIARLGTLIANSFGSGKDPITENAFLPYPKPEKTDRKMSDRTAKLLLKYVKSGTLPSRMISLVSVLLDEAKKLE